jgi:OTU domain-containing protein 6
MLVKGISMSYIILFSRMTNTVYMRDKSAGSLKTIAEYGQDYGNENPERVLYHGYGHYDAPPSVI